MFRNTHRTLFFSLLLFAAWGTAAAQSVQKPEEDITPEGEMATFEMDEGFEVNLFADESDGVANPIAIRFGPRGRLWVLCTWAYPQLEPDDVPDDKLLILEDTDKDGRADKKTIFADKLDMPTGFALGHGGVYLGEGTDLVHLKDTDGDDRADTRDVVFTGFGTGDTHQNINSFAWSPGGELMFCQGLHTFSRVETPWGIERLDEHGFWRLRPRRRQLDAFYGGSGANPWGIAFDRWGAPLIKSGSGAMVSEMLSNLVHSGRWQRPDDIGSTPIKSMIITYADSPHLPEEMREDLLIAGYFGHLIDRMQITPDGSGHRAVNREPVLRSDHRGFRPVDIQIGPDGAIYISDWYNPIIGHYQASFRHPDRDKDHGRIWRITAKDRPLAEIPDFMAMDAAALCRELASPVRFHRDQAKRLLSDLEAGEVTAALEAWIASLTASDPGYEHHLYEALGVYEDHEVVRPELLKQLLSSENPKLRSYAVRVVGRWYDRLEDPLAILRVTIQDSHPRVRLETIVAASNIPEAEAMGIAARALDGQMDRFQKHALAECTAVLAPHWIAALEAGQPVFADPEHLVYALRTTGQRIAPQIRMLLSGGSLQEGMQRKLRLLLAEVGSADDLLSVFEAAQSDPKLLVRLSQIAEQRRVVPQADLTAALTPLLESEDPKIRIAAIRLAGAWRQRGLLNPIDALLDAGDQPKVRAVAMRAMETLAPENAAERFRRFISSDEDPDIAQAALAALAKRDLEAALRAGLILYTAADEAGKRQVLEILMQRRGSTAALATVIESEDISRSDAESIARWLSAAGKDEPQLAAALQRAMGIEPVGEMEFDPAFVAKLAAEVQSAGDVEAGKSIFNSSLTNCTACHFVGAGPVDTKEYFKGPELSAVSAGLPVDLIIQAVIWPARQVKEGYELTTLYLDDGRVLSGYITRRAHRTVTIRDLGSGREIVVDRDAIEDFDKQGTAMPAGFTRVLSRQQLRDLVAYLVTLKGGGKKAAAEKK
jgi:putative heme-binding domain-containing protein